MAPATLPSSATVKYGKRIFQFIDEKILLAGTRGLDNKEDLKRTRLINSMCAITAFLALSIGFLFYVLTGLFREIFIPAAIEASLFSLIILLNVGRRYALASFASLIVHLACAVYFAFMLGFLINVVIILAFLFGLCRLMYKDKLQRGISMAAIALALIVIEANGYLQIVKPLDMPESSQWIFRWIALPSFLFFFAMILDYYDIEIKRLYKQIKDIVRHVVHDLRNIIVANTSRLKELKEELSKEAPDLERIKTLANELSSANNNMNVIVSNVLDKAAEQISWRIYNETFSLEDLIKNVTITLSSSADARGLTISRWYDQDMPEFIVSDLGRMNTVLINYLSNAIKYSESESTVRIAVLKDSDYFTISVTNSCPRIPEEKLTRLFDEDFTAKSDEKIVGNGLGLYIVKRTIEEFNGTYGVTSNDTETTFYVRLRLIPGEKVEISEIIGDSIDYKGASIYYAEDDLMNSMFVSRYLTDLGYKVTTFKNGHELLFALNENFPEPDCFLLDDHMPYMTGLELLRILKGNDLFKDIPTIILTGDSYKEAVDEFKIAKADEVLVKSGGQLSHIRKALSQHLKKKQPLNAG